MARYRAGIIACGSIARSHARGWRAIQDLVDLVAIADTSEEALRESGERWEVPSERRYTDFRAMLDRERLDIVSVCSWHGLHASMVSAAAARRPRAILCEKPMATCLGEADDMITACRRNQVKLAIGHMRRFFSGWEEARRLVGEGAIGEPRLIRTIVAQGLLNWGTHTIDGVRFVLGDPGAEWVMGAVQRKTDRYERAMRIEDACAGLVQFADGPPGPYGMPGPQLVIEADLTPRASINFQIYGTEGQVEVENDHVRLLSPASGGWRELETPDTDPFAAQAREVVAWIDDRIQGYRGEAVHGRAALEIMMAIYESARRHEVVRLPLLTRVNPLDLMVESGQLPVEYPGRYDIRSFLVRGEAMRWE